MRTIKLYRTFKEGIKNIKRNGWLAIASTSILTLSLFIVTFSILLGFTTNLLLDNLRDKISVNVSFNPDVSEQRIKEVQTELSKYTQDIESVTYVSRDQALHDFLEQNNNDPTIKQAIDEIGDNPLLASLVVKATSSDKYPLIVDQLQSSAYQNDIARINYERNKKIFDRLEVIHSATKKVGLGLGILFTLIAVLITFNTVRITIYSHRKEYEVMRLVGASNLYVRMPILFEGAIYGLIASTFTLIFLLLVALYIGPLTKGALKQGDLFQLYLHYLPAIIPSVVFLGVGLGVISSAIAIRRYLKI